MGRKSKLLDFPDDTWFGQLDTYKYPENIPSLYIHLLRKDGQVYTLFKAIKRFTQLVFTCFSCKTIIPTGEYSFQLHVKGKIHEKSMKELKDEYEVIDVDHEFFLDVHKHITLNLPPQSIISLRQKSKNSAGSRTMPKLLPLHTNDSTTSEVGTPNQGSHSRLEKKSESEPAANTGSSKTKESVISDSINNKSVPKPVPHPSSFSNDESGTTSKHLFDKKPVPHSSSSNNDRSHISTNIFEKITSPKPVPHPSSSNNEKISTITNLFERTTSPKPVPPPSISESDVRSNIYGGKSDAPRPVPPPPGSYNLDQSSTRTPSPSIFKAVKSGTRTRSPSNSNDEESDATTRAFDGSRTHKFNLEPVSDARARNFNTKPDSDTRSRVFDKKFDCKVVASPPSASSSYAQEGGTRRQVNLSQHSGTSTTSNPLNQESGSRLGDGGKSLSGMLSLPKPVSASKSKQQKKCATVSGSLSVSPPLAVVRPGVHADLTLPQGCADFTTPPQGLVKEEKTEDTKNNKSKASTTSPTLSKPLEANELVDGLFLKENLRSCSKFFANSRDCHLIGLEYLIEIEQDMFLPHVYSCRLCNLTLSPTGSKNCLDSMKEHLDSSSHKLKYLEKYFPTIYEYKLKRRCTVAVINDTVKSIECLLGRKEIRMFKGFTTYYQQLAEIDKAIQDGDHFRETQRIVDIVMKKIPLPKSSQLDKIFDDCEDIEDFDDDESQAADKPVKSKDSPKLNLDNIDTGFLKNIVDAVNKPIDVKTEKAEDDRTAKVEKSDKTDDEANAKVDIDEENLSDISNDEIVTKEEKQMKHKEERNARVLAFKAEVEVMEKAMDKAKEELAENPSNHPDYSREWTKFYKRKSAELRSKNVRPEGMDFKPEWIVQWTAYFEAEFVGRRTKARESLMRKYKLLQRDLDLFEAAHRTEQQLSPISDKGDDDQVLLEREVTPPEMSRCSSPWEDEGEVPGLRNRSNSGTPVRDEWSPNTTRNARTTLPDMALVSRHVDTTSTRQKRQDRSPFLGRIRQDRSALDLQKFQNPSSPGSRRSLSPRGEKRRLSPSSPSLRNKKHLDKFSSDGADEDRGSNMSAGDGSSNEVTVISTLRLMSALDQAGFLKEFGREIDEQFARAIANENQRKGSSINMIHERQCLKLMARAKEKLQTIMKDPAHSPTESELKVLRIVLDNLIIFNQRTNLTPEDLADKPAPDEEDRKLKMAIAKTINDHLSKQGRTVSDEDFCVLVESEFDRVKKRLQEQQQMQQGPSTANAPSRISSTPQLDPTRAARGGPPPPLGRRQMSRSPSPFSSGSRSSGGVHPSGSFSAGPRDRLSEDYAAGPSRSSRELDCPPMSHRSRSPASRDRMSDEYNRRSLEHDDARTYNQHPGDTRSYPDDRRFSRTSHLPEPRPGPSTSSGRYSHQPPPTPSLEKYEDDVIIGFTDDELISLLQNFKTLEPLEQKDLISHMKKLEREDPDRVNRLKEAMHNKRDDKM